jgi:hypothetical protein
MKPDRYELSNTGPQRLSGTLQKRGSKMGMPTWGGFLLGLPFLGVGAAAIGIGTHVLRVDPATIHAPYWVLSVFGVSFLGGGLAVWGGAWKQFSARRRRSQAARQYAGEPALVDYPWHPDGFEVTGWAAAIKTMALALALTVFLSIFNWWAFGQGGPILVKAIVILFDAVTVLLWCQAAQAVGRAIKFGHSRIVFTRFPYRVGEPVVVRWRPSEGVSEMRKGTFTLRCVQEWTETTGSGKNRSTKLVHEELWSARWLLEQSRRLGPKDDVELSYELPPNATATQLSADRPVFWELEVKLDLPGLDFKQTYLVPVYAAKTAPRLKPILLNQQAVEAP